MNISNDPTNTDIMNYLYKLEKKIVTKDELNETKIELTQRIDDLDQKIDITKVVLIQRLDDLNQKIDIVNTDLTIKIMHTEENLIKKMTEQSDYLVKEIMDVMNTFGDPIEDHEKRIRILENKIYYK